MEVRCDRCGTKTVRVFDYDYCTDCKRHCFQPMALKPRTTLINIIINYFLLFKKKLWNIFK